MAADDASSLAPSISLEAVSVDYGALRAVDGLSVEVRRGELLMLVGGSGSGKTTALKTINRLVEPTEGVVRLGTEDVCSLDASALRRRIGYCFQGVGLFPHLTVAENVGVTPMLLSWDEDRIRARVDELLERVELDPKRYRERLPDALSGGQRQRIGVARALAAEPQVVLFDEPFGALDPITREQLQRQLVALRSELDLTGVFVTHDIVEALTLGDRVAVMRSGRLLQVGTHEELLSAPADNYVKQLVETPLRTLRRLEGGA